MTFDGYLAFGGREVINSERARGYAETADCPMNWLKGMPCFTLPEAVGDTRYDYSDITTAPWYDSTVDDISRRFYGVYGLSIDGVEDSTRSAIVTESIDDGGVIGRSRRATRNVTAKALLIGKGQDALEYGMSWLTASLDPDGCGQISEDCGTAQMGVFSSCPPARKLLPEYTEWVEQARNFALNPSFEYGDGTTQVLHENLMINPYLKGSGTFNTVYENLITNPGGETAQSGSTTVPAQTIYRNDLSTPTTTGWTASLVAANGSGATGASVALQGAAGTRVVRVQTDGATTSVNPTAAVRMTLVLTTVVGVQYTVTYQYKAVSSACMARVSLGTAQGPETSSNVLAAGTAVVFTATSTTTNLVFDVYDNSGSTGTRDSVYGELGDVTVTQASYVIPASGPVEVRRNSALNPRQVSAGSATEAQGRYSGQFSQTFVTGTTGHPAGITTAARLTCTADTTGAGRGFDWYGNADIAAPLAAWTTAPVVSAGQTVTVRVWGRSNRSIPSMGIGIRFYDGTALTWTSAYIQGTQVSSTGGQWSLLTVTAVAPAGSTRFVVRGVNNVSSFAYLTGDTLDQSGLYLGINDSGPYFDGVAQASPVDTDLTTAWSGTAHSSASLLTGVPVAGFTARECVAIQSQQWKKSGTYSIRIIPTGTSTDSSIEFTLPAAARAGGTALATFRLNAPLTGTLHARSRRIVVFLNEAQSAQVPNAAGTTDLRFNYPAVTASPFSVRFYHGGSRGSGDIYLDELGVFAGSYDGPWFDGDSLPAYRKNWAMSPYGLAGWYSTDGAAYSREFDTSKKFRPDSVGAVKFVRISQSSPGPRIADTIYAGSGGSLVDISGGEVWTTSLSASASVAFRARHGVAFFDPFGTTIGAITYSSWVSGATGQVVTSTLTTTAPANAASFRVVQTVERATGNSETGDIAWMSDALYEKTNQVLPYFDGFTQTGSELEGVWTGGAGLSASELRDHDLSVAWSGTPEASTSLLRGEAVFGIANNPRCVAVRSDKFGGSMRLIPTSATDNNSYVEISPVIPIPLQVYYTFMAELSLEKPLTGSLNVNALRLGMLMNLVVSAAAPNAAGTTQLRRSSPLLTGAGTGRFLFYHGGLQGSGSVYYSKAAILKSQYFDDWFSGSTQSEDSDRIYAWTGTPDASSSTVSAVFVEDDQILLSSPGAAIRSGVWSKSGTYSMRLRPSTGVAYAAYPVPAELQATGGIALVTAHVKEAFEPSSSIFPSITDGLADTAVVPSEPGTYRLGVKIAPGTAQIYLTSVNPGVDGLNVADVWYDEFGMFNQDENVKWFDGDGGTVKFGQEDLTRFSWAGEPNNSESIMETRQLIETPQSDEAWADDIDKTRRFMRGAAAISGPFKVSEMASGDFWAYEVQFTLAGGPSIIGVTKALQLAPALPVVVQDIAYNLVPYPSAEKSSGTMVAATNYSTNPSVETDATGWSSGTDGAVIVAANVTSGRVTGELSASGTSSFRSVFTAPGASAAAGYFFNQQEVNLSARPANSRVSINLWSAGFVQSGAPVGMELRMFAYWRGTSGGATLRTDDLGTVPVDGGNVSLKSLQPPAGANFVLVRAQLKMNSWNAGTVVRLYSDALAVTVP